MTLHPFPARVAPFGRAAHLAALLRAKLTAPVLSEAFGAHPLDGAAAGFVLAALPVGRVLWVQDRLSRAETGAPFLPGVGRALLRLELGRAQDVLAAMEDGLRSIALAGVVGELYGSPRALDFTASRRLALRAEAAGLPCWLIRHAAPVADASAARMRWRLAALASLPDPDDPAAPGLPRWRAELFRGRGLPASVWEMRHDRAAGRLDLAPFAGDGSVAGAAAPAGRSMAR